MSIDSQTVREIMSTYYVKERYYIKKVMEKGMAHNEIGPHSFSYFLIQLKGMLNMPFLNVHYLTEVLHVFPHEHYFAVHYLEEIYSWIDRILRREQVPV
jgi:hypothetical protein